MKHVNATLTLGASALAFFAGAAHADTLEGLGFLPDGVSSAAYFGASANGSVLVGVTLNTLQQEAFRWTQTGGMVGLGDLPGGGFGSEAWDVSADGSVVVGIGTSASGGEAFRWTQGGGMVGLGDLPGGSFYSLAYGVSGDGLVVVGDSDSGTGNEAFRWTQADGMVGLGTLPGGGFGSTAYGVSGDGRVVVGVSSSASGAEAFRWTQTGGMVGLGNLAGGASFSFAVNTNKDGSVVVGWGETATRTEAFRWTQSGGMVGLGVLTDASSSIAYGVSDNGMVVVGASDDKAFAWTANDGMRAVADVLTANGVDVSAWNLSIATSVSGNGKTVAGIGQRGDAMEAWIANIDLGLVSIEDVALSLSSVVGVNQSAQQTGAAHVDGLLNLAAHYGAPTGKNGWSAWGSVSSQHYDVLRIDPEAVAGQLGLAFAPSSAWRVGFGVQWGEREDDLNVFASESDSKQWGAGLFATYAPAQTGLHVHTAFTSNHIANDITRGYLNGSTLVFSAGSLDGRAYGAGLQVGWAYALRDAMRVTPFASYQASRLMLDPYTETSGPFPATFEGVEDTLEIARLGAEAEHRYSDKLRTWASLAYAHCFSDKLPGVRGAVTALSSPFTIEGASVDQNWGAAQVGGEWRTLQAMRLQANVSVASAGDTDANYGGRLTLVYDF